MLDSRLIIRCFSLSLVTLVLTTSVAAQDNSQAAPATQPAASAPATEAAPNPLPTPLRMVEFLRDRLAAGAPEDAVICLNFSQVDDEVRRERGPEYVTKLGEILDLLIEQGSFDPSKLPDDPTAPPQTIGKDPLLLVLERQEKPAEGVDYRLWQVAASSVRDIPQLYERRDQLARMAEHAVQEQEAAKPAAAPEEEEPLNRLRSPYHMVELFRQNAQRDIVAEIGAELDSQITTWKCGSNPGWLPFSSVSPDAIAEKRIGHHRRIGYQLRVNALFRQGSHGQAVPYTEVIRLFQSGQHLISKRRSQVRQLDSAHPAEYARSSF